MDIASLNIDGRSGTAITISTITFAGIVLTYESCPPSILRKDTFTRVFVHHAVLIPLCRNTIGTTSTEFFALARFLGSGLNTAFGGSSHVSVTITPLLGWWQWHQEVKFRRKYGISAALNQRLVASQRIPRATPFLLYDVNDLNFVVEQKKYYTIHNRVASTLWDEDLLTVIEHECSKFEPLMFVNNYPVVNLSVHSNLS